MNYALLYICTVILVNIAFAHIPLVFLPGGEAWSPAALLVGFVFIIRDYAQRELGHKILVGMLVAGAVSWYMASPQVALASTTAFLVGETLDWLIYSTTRRPFSQRVLLSSAVGTPIDSAVFMFMIGLFSWPSVIMMTASKMVGAIIVFFMVRHREHATAAKEATL